VIPSNARLNRNPQVVSRGLGSTQGSVLLHLESGQYHGLNEIGAVIWDLLDGTRTLGDVQAEVRRRVSDPPARLEDDVAKYLEGLHDRQLIVISTE
jgi:hypothetical protein